MKQRALVVLAGLFVGLHCKSDPQVGGPITGTGGSPTGGAISGGSGGSAGSGGAASPDAASTGGTGGPGGAQPDAANNDTARDTRLDAAPGAADAGGGMSIDPPGPWARGVRVTLVEATQAVFVKIGDGQTVVPPTQRNAPLIEKRPLLVRVHVTADAGFTARRLRAVLTVETDGVAPGKWEESKMISGSSTADALNSTFNILVPAPSVLPRSTMWAAVYETGAAMGPEPAPLPRFPGAGTADLAIKEGRMELDIVFVQAYLTTPIGDSPERRKKVENYFYDIYPVQKLNMVFHEPVKLERRINSPSEGFALLRDLRTRENAKGWEYYALLVARNDANQGGGVAPLVTTDGLNAGAQRISYNKSSSDNLDSDTNVMIMAHEVGHNHGRNHNPGCGATGLDPGFPYAPGGLGVNGFSLSAMAIRPKAMYTDYMAYCFPKWISDWTYGKLEIRVRGLTAAKVGAGAHSALISRSLQGFVARDGQANFGVAVGALVPEGASITPARYAVLTLAGGSRVKTAVSVTLLSDDETREVSVNLPDDTGAEVVGADVFVDGTRFAVPPATLSQP